MADRSSAEIFGEIFHMLAEVKRGHPVDVSDLAFKFWEKSRDYDFSPYQMYIDEDLFELGYAVRAVDPAYPRDGETTIYYDDEAFDAVMNARGDADSGEPGGQEE